MIESICELNGTSPLESQDQSVKPLAGIKVIEMSAIGPVPFCGMILADLGANVVRVDRVTAAGLGIAVDPSFDFLARGKSSIAVDLKHPQGKSIIRDLLRGADILIEGFRPSVMEHLSLGPQDCFKVNPRLVFGRCSGWGDKGPLASSAGHDINYLALCGALAALGPKELPPPPPLNLIADFGGAAMHLTAGVIAALVATKATGHGRVVSASIADSCLSLMTMIYGLHSAGCWSTARGDNVLDGGAPYYRTYATSDLQYVAVGALERKFYIALLEKLDLLGQINPERQHDRQTWPQTARLFERVFASRTRDAWSDVFASSDACVTPVLRVDEVAGHPQHAAAGAFVCIEGRAQPAPAIKFSQSRETVRHGPRQQGADTREILTGLAYKEEVIAQLTHDGVIACAH